MPNRRIDLAAIMSRIGHAKYLSISVIAISIISATDTRAELKDYQVGRLIMLRSDCQVVGLTRKEESNGSWTYLGRCSNESFYPDGIRVRCPDPESNDERTCVIETKARKFESLRLLQPQNVP